MRTIEHPHGLRREELQEMAARGRPGDIDDMEFLESLARQRCLVMPPWVYHIGEAGHLEKVTPVRYGPDYNLDKPTMLLAVMEKLPHTH